MGLCGCCAPEQHAAFTLQWGSGRRRQRGEIEMKAKRKEGSGVCGSGRRIFFRRQKVGFINSPALSHQRGWRTGACWDACRESEVPLALIRPQLATSCQTLYAAAKWDSSGIIPSDSSGLSLSLYYNEKHGCFILKCKLLTIGCLDNHSGRAAWRSSQELVPRLKFICLGLRLTTTTYRQTPLQATDRPSAVQNGRLRVNVFPFLLKHTFVLIQTRDFLDITAQMWFCR